MAWHKKVMQQKYNDPDTLKAYLDAAYGPGNWRVEVSWSYRGVGGLSRACGKSGRTDETISPAPSGQVEQPVDDSPHETLARGELHRLSFLSACNVED